MVVPVLVASVRNESRFLCRSDYITQYNMSLTSGANAAKRFCRVLLCRISTVISNTVQIRTRAHAWLLPRLLEAATSATLATSRSCTVVRSLALATAPTLSAMAQAKVWTSIPEVGGKFRDPEVEQVYAVKGGLLLHPVILPVLNIGGVVYARLGAKEEWLTKLLCGQSRRNSPLKGLPLWERLHEAAEVFAAREKDKDDPCDNLEPCAGEGPRTKKRRLSGSRCSFVVFDENSPSSARIYFEQLAGWGKPRPWIAVEDIPILTRAARRFLDQAAGAAGEELCFDEERQQWSATVDKDGWPLTKLFHVAQKHNGIELDEEELAKTKARAKRNAQRWMKQESECTAQISASGA